MNLNELKPHAGAHKPGKNKGATVKVKRRVEDTKGKNHVQAVLSMLSVKVAKCRCIADYQSLVLNLECRSTL